jgi:hypothetical protein
MKIAFILVLVFVLGVFPLIALVEQVRRDYVGKRRNMRGQCYACATAKGTLLPIPHYKGNIFMYCVSCADTQLSRSKVTGYVLLATCVVALAAWVIFSYA